MAPQRHDPVVWDDIVMGGVIVGCSLVGSFVNRDLIISLLPLSPLNEEGKRLVF